MIKSEFLQIIKERGFFHQATDEANLDKLLADEKITAYIGFDCTAPSLHVGNLMQIMVLKWLQLCGHKVIILLGGGTSKVGDPSGKDEARKLLSADDIENNKQGIRQVFAKYLELEGNNGAIIVDNDDWLAQINYLEFLRDVGRHFSVNRMLSFDSVKLRLEREQNLSFLEFNYMILQAYDFVELNKKYGCALQIGGSDQWGNIVNGIELGRRMGLKKELFGLTTPLITTSSGAKMGKTVKGALWLNEDMCSVFDFWQYWRNVEDADVGRFLRLYSLLPIDKIKELEKLQGADINNAKIILANAITELCHGEEKAQLANETAKKTFEEGGFGDALPELSLSKEQILQGSSIFKLFVQLGLASSGGEARRLIKGGGARINDEVIKNELQLLQITDFTNNVAKLSAGRKKHAVVKLC